MRNSTERASKNRGEAPLNLHGDCSFSSVVGKKPEQDYMIVGMGY